MLENFIEQHLFTKTTKKQDGEGIKLNKKYPWPNLGKL